MLQRSHQTAVNGIASDLAFMKNGEPEGSSLGPLLFLIYINDLKYIFEDENVNILADDTYLSISGINESRMYEVANTKLMLLNDYLAANSPIIFYFTAQIFLQCNHVKIYSNRSEFTKRLNTGNRLSFRKDNGREFHSLGALNEKNRRTNALLEIGV